MHNHQVLIVDDDEDIRESLVDYLQDHGFEPIGAADGRDALEKLRGRQVRPCAIILDLMMPVMDGRMFREEQLRIPELSGIPVIVISAHRDVSGGKNDLNAVAQLPKPVNLTALLRVLKEHCRPS